MRRAPFAVLVFFFFSTAAFAGVNDSNPRDIGREAGGRHMILHAAALTQSDRAELAAKGVIVQTPLTGDRYVAIVRDETVADARVRSFEPITANAKIDRGVYAQLAHGRTWTDVNVIFHEDVTYDEARAAILAAGGTIDPLRTRFLPAQRVVTRIAPAAVTALANDDRVLGVVGPRTWRPASDNAPSAALSHVTDINASPYNLTGEGVAVSLFELAAGQGDHIEFGTRNTVFAVGGASGDKAHATHTAGTIGATGLRPDAKGMAPNVRIYQFCVESGSNDCTTQWLDDKEEKLAPLGVVADNNSWGFILGWSSEGGIPVWNNSAEYYGAYDLVVAAPLDKISNEKNVLFVHSAGNDAVPPSFLGSPWSEHRHVDDNFETIPDKTFCYSQDLSGTDCPAGTCNGGCEVARHHQTEPYDTIGVTAAAKNVITVGAITSNSQITNFSSRGPAKDGRVKPDVVTRGFNVLSTVPINSYATNNGTSMAAPVVTGVAALLTEQWRRSHAGANPTAGQLRALILAGTDDLGTPGPDYTFGFGLVNAKTAADYIINDDIHDYSVTPNQQIETRLVVNSTGKLRVALSWPDPYIPIVLGGDDIAAKALVNDLDLKVIAPNGTTFLPYVLDKNNPGGTATTGVNTTDNFEEVEIADAAPGVYRAIINGTDVKSGLQTAYLVANAAAQTVAPCRDLTEPNDDAAYGNLVPGQRVDAAVCTQNDVDQFKFVVTAAGPVTVTITTGDTPVRATLTGVANPVDVPANSTRSISTNVTTVPTQLTLRIVPADTIGAQPAYSITPDFGQTIGPRRRSSRH